MTLKFGTIDGRLVDATPRNLAIDASQYGDKAIHFIDKMDGLQSDEGFTAEQLHVFAIGAWGAAVQAAHQARASIAAGGIAQMIQLLPLEKLGLSAALEYAFEDQHDYLERDARSDYGDDWYDARHLKITQFKGMAELAELIGEIVTAGKFRDLAAELQQGEDDDNEEERKLAEFEDKQAAAEIEVPEPAPMAVPLADDDIPW